MRYLRSIIGLALVPCLLLSGCEFKQPPTANSAKPSEHDHHHEHETGPNGGHLGHLEPSDEHFEWTHDDKEHTVSFHFEELVSAGKKIDSVGIEVTSGSDTKSFKLEADPKAKIAGSKFTIKNEELMTLLGASGTDEKGVKSKLIVDLDGKKQTAVLEHDDHDHDHGHKH